MKSLFSDNRLANMLHLFHNTQTMSVNNMAAKLRVSDRTIRNDIKQLNQTLNGCALIEGFQGRYTLRVFDADMFKKILSELSEADEFLNSPRNRMDYMFGKLMRAEMPLLIDDLAYEMSIGRTTLAGDLKKLRTELEDYSLQIPGKTSQGISLYGNEFDIRRYVLENNFDQIYGTFPLDREIDELIDDVYAEKHLEDKAKANFRRFIILMLDRFLTGHYLGQISDKAYDLTARPEFMMVNDIVDQIGQILQIVFPVEEKLFALLPVIGMRTPSDVQGMRSIELDESIRPLLPKINEQIRIDLNLSIEMGDFTEEFLYHLMFMINRMRLDGRRCLQSDRERIQPYHHGGRAGFPRHLFRSHAGREPAPHGEEIQHRGCLYHRPDHLPPCRDAASAHCRYILFPHNAGIGKCLH